MTYGVDILPENDPNLQLARRASIAVNQSLETGSRFVDLIPVLKYLPAWFPGASFQKVAAQSRIMASNLREGIFTEAHKKWVSFLSLKLEGGYNILICWRKSSHVSHNPSFASLCLDEHHEETGEEQLSIMKDVAGIVYMGKDLSIRTFPCSLKVSLSSGK